MTKPIPPTALNPALASWLHRKKWAPFAYQEEAWTAYLSGESGLVNAPTGMGKTYSVWLGPLSEWLNENPDRKAWSKIPPMPTLLWITPLRALSNDTAAALRAPLTALKLPWTLEQRTGDTSSSIKARQRVRLPTALITTPESLSVLISYDGTQELLRTLKCVVVDEWHELMGSKRGTQTELALARLRFWIPNLRTWGLSATIGNLDCAMNVLMSSSVQAPTGHLVRGPLDKETRIITILPESMDRFPWSGHIGLRLLPQVTREIAKAKTTLLFTNTRAQAELWYKSILVNRPRWESCVAVHHGSLDRNLREDVEERLRRGKLRCVVCTSSLDLGVDFPAVDQVVQVGSPKGVARLMQRAGRSGHQPGGVSRILCVPTNAFELVEYAAARDAAEKGRIEDRPALDRPLDVLVQHLVTVAMGGGFEEEDLFEEVRGAYSFRNLSRTEWEWAMDFVTRGGVALRAYPQYQKLAQVEGRFTVPSRLIQRFHRLNIGTITGDPVITIKLMNGLSLGTVEESFIARMKPGSRFVFAGRKLQLVRFRDLVATVKLSSDGSGMLPNWAGSRMAISSELGRAVRDKMSEACHGTFAGPEMEKVQPVLKIQKRWSAIPERDEVLIESIKTREGHNLFVYPFEGLAVHEGLGALVAYRVSKRWPRTIIVTMNDYGFQMVSDQSLDFSEEDWRSLLSPDCLLEHLLGSLNAAELARRQFREIARVAGLIFGGYPGASKSQRQIQASSGLLYDVFARYDPANLLLDQARREVLDRQMDIMRLRQTLQRISQAKIMIVPLERLTPLAFPLWASRIASSRASLSSEKMGDRVKRMVMELETMADEELCAGSPRLVAKR